MNTPAPWIVVGDLADPTSPYAAEAVEAASWVLWMLSARKYGGVRQVTEVYCQVGLRETTLASTSIAAMTSGSGMQMYPTLRDGRITNQIGGCCSTCGCEHTIRLRGGPVRSVISIYDGERELTSGELADVAIYDYSYITAVNKCWSTCGDLEVTYEYGTDPPAMGKIAARDLANQYVMAMAGDDECALPQRVTQVSRQGVSWTLLDPQDFLDNGRTGLYTVDLFLRTSNPDRARLRSRVFSPDLHRARSYRWAGPQAGLFGAPQLMSQPVLQAMPTAVRLASETAVQVYTGQPLRWVVPGSFTEERPPVVTVRPSGEEVPPGTLLWRSGNYTLDLTTAQVEQLLPPGSVLVVSTAAENGSTTSQTSHPVERRTP